MKLSNVLVLSLILGCYSSTGFSGSINDSFSRGDTLTAGHLNNIKQAVNDNQEQVTDNAQSIVSNKAVAGGNAAAIQRLDDGIKQNKKNVLGNSKGISTLNLNISNLQPKLSDVTCDGFSYVQGFDADSKVVCSTDILGTGYSRLAPVFQDNIAKLEIDGINVQGSVFIISGVGVDIERIEQFIEFQPRFIPGQNMEHDFVIETDDFSDVNELKFIFDTDPDSPRSMSLIVRQLDNTTEVFRINLYEYIPFSYVDMSSGRTRFTFTQSLGSNNTLQVETDPLKAFSSLISNNPETDTLIEIEGITSNFYPQVEVDEVKKIMTLTYDINEGRDLLLWTKVTASGLGTHRGMSVIQQTNGVETSRKNYFEVFPVSWEIFDGFSLPQKIKARIRLSFDYSEDV